jgi:hypothetical protein
MLANRQDVVEHSSRALAPIFRHVRDEAFRGFPLRCAACKFRVRRLTGKDVYV